MKNINTKRKTESNIRIFKDWLSTVGEHRNPEYIGVEEIYMHLARFFFSVHEIQTAVWETTARQRRVEISDGE